MKFSVRYVHKISPSVQDIGLDVDLSFKARLYTRNLAQELRDLKVLEPGTRVREFRQEGQSLVVFPDRGIWHSVILTAKELDWFVVINEEKTILAVCDGLSEAQAEAKKIQDNTGCLTYVEKGYRAFRQNVGEKYVPKSKE